MDFTKIVTAFVSENVLAALLVFVIAAFVWYFVDERKHQRSVFQNLSDEYGKIYTKILFIEDSSRRLEKQIGSVSGDLKDMDDVFDEVKSSLQRIDIIISERLKSK